MSESYPYLDDGEYELGFGAGKFMAKTKLFFLLNANSTTRMKAYPYAAHHIKEKKRTRAFARLRVFGGHLAKLQNSLPNFRS
jgi:hypothetical protein